MMKIRWIIARASTCCLLVRIQYESSRVHQGEASGRQNGWLCGKISKRGPLRNPPFKMHETYERIFFAKTLPLRCTSAHPADVLRQVVTFNTCSRLILQRRRRRVEATKQTNRSNSKWKNRNVKRNRSSGHIWHICITVWKCGSEWNGDGWMTTHSWEEE